MPEIRIPISLSLVHAILCAMEDSVPDGPIEQWVIDIFHIRADPQGSIYAPCTRTQARDMLENMRRMWDWPNLSEDELQFMAHVILRATQEQA